MSIPSNTIPCIASGLLKLRTSTNADGHSSHYNINLNNQNYGYSSWIPSINDINQFVLGGSDNPKEFIAIATQGSNDNNNWVTRYRIRYSLDNLTWFEYNNGQSINANTDKSSVFVYTFPTPLVARSISIHPMAWNNNIAMRLEFYCKTSKYENNQLIPSVSSGQNTPLWTNNGVGTANSNVDATFDREPKSGLIYTTGLNYIDSLVGSQGETNLYTYTFKTRNLTVAFLTVSEKIYEAKVYVFSNENYSY